MSTSNAPAFLTAAAKFSQIDSDCVRSIKTGWNRDSFGRRAGCRDVPQTSNPRVVSSLAVSRPMPELAPVRKTVLDSLMAIVPAAQSETDVGAAKAARVVERDAGRVGDGLGDDGHNGTLRIELRNVRRNRREFFLQREDAERSFHGAGQ